MQDKSKDVKKKSLRSLPSIEKILQAPDLKKLIEVHSQKQVAEVAREVVDSFRKKIMKGEEKTSEKKIIQQIQKKLEDMQALSLKAVINGTGVLIHTNLGRAPLSEETFNYIAEIGVKYSNLEFDLLKGKRGERTLILENLICELTKAEGALVVNNNASAVLLVLAGLAEGKEVLVSRGELVQIGGGFKVPEIMEQSKAILREVGTTNQTTARNYQDKINKNTGLILKVHKSNFRMEGFVKEATLKELVFLGKKNKIPVFEDLGSGCFLNSEDYGLAHEPTPYDALRTGVDLVSFSGDKLLGGPQSGIILGRKKYTDFLRKHPLYRALRVDKLVISGLENVILTYLKREAVKKIPVWRMISTPIGDLRKRAEKIKKELRKSNLKLLIGESKSTVGGGSLPGETLPTIVISFETKLSPDLQAQRFREENPPIIGRIEKNRFVLDLRTIFPHQDREVLRSIISIFKNI
ncbi:MAG: hypothetical protein AMJ90_05195 [candidate division Zixibacteria bacterium SM23_73_2]|nr:MAG: hypothetical protein AMJ90_05195 [candidate division Zixibacteria bacterium SM23_73_2]